MNLKALIPSPFEVGKEAAIVIAGAVVAAVVVAYLPGLRAWIFRQWSPSADTVGVTEKWR